MRQSALATICRAWKSLRPKSAPTDARQARVLSRYAVPDRPKSARGCALLCLVPIRLFREVRLSVVRLRCGSPHVLQPATLRLRLFRRVVRGQAKHKGAAERAGRFSRRRGCSVFHVVQGSAVYINVAAVGRRQSANYSGDGGFTFAAFAENAYFSPSPI